MQFLLFLLLRPATDFRLLGGCLFALQGSAHNIIGDAELASQLEKEQSNTENLKETIKLLKEQIESLNSQIKRLDSNLKDKDAIIELLKERR